MPPQPRVFFDFAIDDESLCRVVFELFINAVPKTAENFRALCTGSRGISPISSLPLHYKSSIVHRIVEGFMIQGGDFTKRTGAGGESIYGGVFEDERLEGEGSEIDKPGLLVMANRGPDTNGSQWFVTLAPAPHLTGKHVVFGRVVGGFEHIQTIGRLPVGEKHRPLSTVMIAHCGELELRKPAAKKVSPERSVSPAKRRSKRSDSVEEKRPRKEVKERRKKKREETEEELDARLEREERERVDQARLEKLAEMKLQLEAERQRVKDSGGVVYKGRGAMRYLDPEAVARTVPNYQPRAPDTRPHRGPPRTADSGDKWQRGPDVGRPSFDKSALDRDLDRYGTKRQKEGESTREKGRDYDDWRALRRRSRSRSRSPVMGRERRRNGSPEQRSNSPRHRTRSAEPGHRKDRSPERGKRKERSPLMRPDSPLRGDRSDGSGSDMVIEEDD